MRLRNVKGSREQIAANEYTIKDAEQIKGRWKDYFQDGKPSGHLVADDRPVVGRKVPGRAAQGTVPLTETYCEYGANHLSAVCGGFSSHPAD